MDYKEREKGFYWEIERAKGKIERLDISEKDRRILYNLVHETVQRHESNMEAFQRGIIASEEFAKKGWELSQALQAISGKYKEVLNRLEGVVGVLEQKVEIFN